MEILLYIIILALACAVFFLLKKLKKLRRNVHYVLDVVENNDYMFRYATGKKSADKETAQYLNELIEVFERKTDEARQQEQYFEIIINSLETGIVVAGENGVIMHSNDAARKLLHRNVLVNLRHANLENQTLDVRSTKMNLHGQPVTIYALNDISKRLEMQELESWEKLTRVLTHEIMNSVTPMTSLCETLLTSMENVPSSLEKSDGNAAKNGEIKQGLAVISETGKSLMDFVNNYRSFTNIPQPKPQLFFVKSFLKRMIEMARHQYPSSTENTPEETGRSAQKINFVLKVKPEDLILYADESLITRVVSNILKNAIEACESESSEENSEKKQSKITVTATIDAQESVTIDIANNGPLIPDADAAQIFVPFYTTRPNGSGIGLALARRIMQSHGGSLSLQNKPQTKFSLFFP